MDSDGSSLPVMSTPALDEPATAIKVRIAVFMQTQLKVVLDDGVMDDGCRSPNVAKHRAGPARNAREGRIDDEGGILQLIARFLESGCEHGFAQRPPRPTHHLHLRIIITPASHSV